LPCTLVVPTRPVPPGLRRIYTAPATALRPIFRAVAAGAWYNLAGGREVSLEP